MGEEEEKTENPLVLRNSILSGPCGVRLWSAQTGFHLRPGLVSHPAAPPRRMKRGLGLEAGLAALSQRRKWGTHGSHKVSQQSLIERLFLKWYEEPVNHFLVIVTEMIWLLS